MATARSLRRARLRLVALPTFRLTVKPTRTSSSSIGFRAVAFPVPGAPVTAAAGGGRRRAWSIRPGVTHFAPAAATLRKSGRVLRRPMIGIIAGLRGQALATLGTAPGEDSAPAHRCLAGPESVATLTDQHTGLKSALHCMNSIVRMDRICRGCIRAATRSVNDAAGRRNNDFTGVSHLGDWLSPGSDATYPGEWGILGRRDGQSGAPWTLWLGRFRSGPWPAGAGGARPVDRRGQRPNRMMPEPHDE